MPLTLSQIRTFFAHPDLENQLNDLVHKKYLRYEHPKKKVGVHRDARYHSSQRLQYSSWQNVL